MQREEWLTRAVERLRPELCEQGLRVPEVRVSCGDLGIHKRGTCYPQEWTVQPEIREIAINLRHTAEAIPVLGTLIHELIHAAGIRNHYRDFQRIAADCGLSPDPSWSRATYLRPEDAPAWAIGLADELGPWPAPRLQTPATEAKQSTRMIKGLRLAHHFFNGHGLK